MPQRSMQSQALALAADLVRTCMLLFEHLGACIIFASFGLFAPRTAIVMGPHWNVGEVRSCD